ncbi:MAG: hypothetical protein V4474_01705 [Patescibacteria group bacterium]
MARRTATVIPFRSKAKRGTVNKLALDCAIPVAAAIGHYVIGYPWWVVLVGTIVGIFLVHKIEI